MLCNGATDNGEEARRREAAQQRKRLKQPMTADQTNVRRLSRAASIDPRRSLCEIAITVARESRRGSKSGARGYRPDVNRGLRNHERAVSRQRLNRIMRARVAARRDIVAAQVASSANRL
jgi:hypothetical protein